MNACFDKDCHTCENRGVKFPFDFCLTCFPPELKHHKFTREMKALQNYHKILEDTKLLYRVLWDVADKLECDHEYASECTYCSVDSVLARLKEYKD